MEDPYYYRNKAQFPVGKNKEGKIVHVGVVLSNGYIAHASGFVRVDRLDSKGILRENDNIYTHFLCKISRFF